jgi:DNA-binding CsgD family transcriptional regulator
MAAFLEVWISVLPRVLPLDAGRVTVGKSPSNDVVVDDKTASRLHAVIERFGSGWCVSDLGSRNGTTVNGERILGQRVLRSGDELRVGATRLVFREDALDAVPGSETATQAAPPELTRREREVLLALCAPVLSGNLLAEPASIKQIAAALVIGESAVKKHLGRLYDKFGLTADEPRRMGRLANDAIHRGAVALGDLQRDVHPG